MHECYSLKVGEIPKVKIQEFLMYSKLWLHSRSWSAWCCTIRSNLTTDPAQSLAEESDWSAGMIRSFCQMQATELLPQKPMFKSELSSSVFIKTWDERVAELCSDFTVLSFNFHWVTPLTHCWSLCLRCPMVYDWTFSVCLSVCPVLKHDIIRLPLALPCGQWRLVRRQAKSSQNVFITFQVEKRTQTIIVPFLWIERTCHWSEKQKRYRTWQKKSSFRMILYMRR